MPPEHDPLETPKGNNAYDPLFADRIEALGKSQTPTPTPPKPSGNNGAAMGVWIVIGIAYAAIRVGSSSSTKPDIPEFKAPRFEERDSQRMIQQLLADQERRQQEINRAIMDKAKADMLERIELPDDPVERRRRLQTIELLKRTIERDKAFDEDKKPRP